MQIRTMTREDVGSLLTLLTHTGPHGHREWNLDGEEGLLSALDNPRLSIESGNWRIAYYDGDLVGYGLVETELNIGRIIVGIATVHGNELIYETLLRDAVARAKAIADRDRFEVHVAVRDTEPEMVAQSLQSADFTVVRTVLKMRGRC